MENKIIKGVNLLTKLITVIKGTLHNNRRIKTKLEYNLQTPR